MMGTVAAMCWGAIGYCVAVWLSDAWENRLHRQPADAGQAGSEGQQPRRAVHGSFLS